MTAELVEVTPRTAATVMLVRDGDAGMEAFMVRRVASAGFAAGAYVFPGGTVDPADRDPGYARWCPGRTDADASATLGLDEGGLALWIAAVRECFEEAGIMLAKRFDGTSLWFDDPEVGARFDEHRRSIIAGKRSLADVCDAEDLRLAVDALHYFAHWITPVGSPRRYDTRFFVATVPEGQEPRYDDGELVAQAWIRPSDALERSRRGDFTLILPTIRNLQAIAPFERTADLMRAAAIPRTVTTVLPEVADRGDGVRVMLPGDDGYQEEKKRR
ncbi:MAG: NUDIX hydrolase [Acidimicrobiales bacterium]